MEAQVKLLVGGKPENLELFGKKIFEIKSTEHTADFVSFFLPSGGVIVVNKRHILFWEIS